MGESNRLPMQQQHAPTQTFVHSLTEAVSLVVLSAVFSLAQTQTVKPSPQDPNLLTRNPAARQHLDRGRTIYFSVRQKCRWKADPNCESAQLAEVVDQANAALVLDPDYAAAHNLLGVAFTDQQKFDEAIAEFHEALRLLPDYYQAHQTET